MSDVDQAKQVLLIGLGSSGIKTVVNLRSEIVKAEHESATSKINCRLLAIDCCLHTSEYFPEDLTPDSVKRVPLGLSEHLSLAHAGMTIDHSWQKVEADANSKVSDAVNLLPQRRLRFGMQAPFRSDYKALIYSSRERLRQVIKDHIQNSKKQTQEDSHSLTIILATSLIGDTGALSYLAILEIFSEFSNELKNVDLSAILFGPELFNSKFHLQPFHVAKYLATMRSINALCWKKENVKVSLTQYLVSKKPTTDSTKYLHPADYVFLTTAKMLNNLLSTDSGSHEWIDQSATGSEVNIECDFKLEFVALDRHKCVELEKSILERHDKDVNFIQNLSEF
jgi:hypothetical protein